MNRHTCNAPSPLAVFLNPPYFSSDPQRRGSTWILTEADRQMNTHCSWTDRWIPTGHQSQTCRQHPLVIKVGHADRQTLTITVGQQLHQAVETGVTDSAYVSCTAPNGLDRSPALKENGRRGLCAKSKKMIQSYLFRKTQAFVR